MSLDIAPRSPGPDWTISKPILPRLLKTDLDFASEHWVRNRLTRPGCGAEEGPRPEPVEASQSETSFGEYAHGGWGSDWGMGRFGIEGAAKRWGLDAYIFWLASPREPLRTGVGSRLT